MLKTEQVKTQMILKQQQNSVFFYMIQLRQIRACESQYMGGP